MLDFFSTVLIQLSDASHACLDQQSFHPAPFDARQCDGGVPGHRKLNPR
jgi:hypothetical protein